MGNGGACAPGPRQGGRNGRCRRGDSGPVTRRRAAQRPCSVDRFPAFRRPEAPSLRPQKGLTVSVPRHCPAWSAGGVGSHEGEALLGLSTTMVPLTRRPPWPEPGEPPAAACGGYCGTVGIGVIRVQFSPNHHATLAATSGATGNSCSVQPPPGDGSGWGRRENGDLQGPGENRGRKNTLKTLQRYPKWALLWRGAGGQQ